MRDNEEIETVLWVVFAILLAIFTFLVIVACLKWSQKHKRTVGADVSAPHKEVDTNEQERVTIRGW